jgi:hypothetical protein
MPVRVALVDDDVRQVAQQAAELAVHGQDGDMQHVRIGDQQLRALAHFAALRLHASEATCSDHQAISNC